MREEHILELLDNLSAAHLDETEMARIREHTALCADCRRKVEAARISNLLLRERAVASIEPPPFFKTRVMAAIREGRADSSSFSFAWLWKTAGKLVFSLMAAVVMLSAFTFYQSTGTTTTQDSSDLAVSSPTSTTEWIVLGTEPPAVDEMTYDQVLREIYDTEDLTNGKQQQK